MSRCGVKIKASTGLDTDSGDNLRLTGINKDDLNQNDFALG